MANADDAPKLPEPLAALFADGGSGRALPITLPAGRLIWPDPQYRSRVSTMSGPAYWLRRVGDGNPVDPAACRARRVGFVAAAT